MTLTSGSDAARHVAGCMGLVGRHRMIGICDAMRQSTSVPQVRSEPTPDVGRAAHYGLGRITRQKVCLNRKNRTIVLSLQLVLTIKERQHDS